MLRRETFPSCCSRSCWAVAHQSPWARAGTTAPSFDNSDIVRTRCADRLRERGVRHETTTSQTTCSCTPMRQRAGRAPGPSRRSPHGPSRILTCSRLPCGCSHQLDRLPRVCSIAMPEGCSLCQPWILLLFSWTIRPRALCSTSQQQQQQQQAHFVSSHASFNNLCFRLPILLEAYAQHKAKSR